MLVKRTFIFSQLFKDFTDYLQSATSSIYATVFAYASQKRNDIVISITELNKREQTQDSQSL